MNTRCETVCNWSEFDEAISQADTPLSVFKAQLKSSNEFLKTQFETGVPVEEVVKQRATLVDQLLTRIWHEGIEKNSSEIALLAVGGYGRGELHPASDVDLLILTASNDATTQHAEQIEKFLLFP